MLPSPMGLFPVCLNWFFPTYSTVSTVSNQSCSMKCVLQGNDHDEFDAVLGACCISRGKSYI